LAPAIANTMSLAKTISLQTNELREKHMSKIVSFALFVVFTMLADPIERAGAEVDHGRIAYQSSVNCIAGASCGCIAGGNAIEGTASCSLRFPAVPRGHRLVVQHISGRVETSGTVIAPLQVTVGSLAGGAFSTFLAFYPLIPALQGAGNPPINLPTETEFDRTILGYVDAGDTPTVAVALTQAGDTGAIGLKIATPMVILTGYILDCATSWCAPIQH
jgi:hypothetical protein